MIPSTIFVVAVALQNKFFSDKLTRNSGSKPKTCTHVLSNKGKYMAGFLVKSFGRFFFSTVVKDPFFWPSSSCILVQKIVSLSMEVNHNRSTLVFVCGNGVYCHHSSSLSRGYIKVLQITARGTNPTSEAIPPGCKTHFAINEKILYLRKMC